MGQSYFGGKRWAQVSRDERFVCYHLFEYLKQPAELSKFVKLANSKGAVSLAETTEWDVGVEVCFYRDLWHDRGKRGPLYSPKRTFDLCLFSDDHIVVIEAKAQQSFDDAKQLQEFRNDPGRIRDLTGVPKVTLLAIGSSRCPFPADLQGIFDGPMLRWDELGRLFGDDPCFQRADEIFCEPEWRANSDGELDGSDLMKAFEAGNEFYVGRGGGLHGQRLRKDISSGKWHTQLYQVNRSADQPPSANWFRLSQFARHVRVPGGRADDCC